MSGPDANLSADSTLAAGSPGPCVQVLIAAPAHSALASRLTYAAPHPLAAGTLVRVPLGRREVLGLVWDSTPADTTPSPGIRPVSEVLASVPALAPPWRQLVDFAAGYYQRSPGEIALAGLPPALRDSDARQMARRLARLERHHSPSAGPNDAHPAARTPPTLTTDQQAALSQIEHAGTEPAAVLLHGVTGSGKTEIYLHLVATLLARDPAAQALILVPEINLTPQLAAQFAARFGEDKVALMHSALTPAQRLNTWLRTHLGQAPVVLGTRLAIWASLPRLRLIIVDEEHDSSYKQQEGARYSSRDLAVMRGRLEGAQVVLGSATPSLESWYLSRPAVDGGRYRRVTLAKRVMAASAVQLRLVSDAGPARSGPTLSAALVDAIAERLARGEQCLLLLNRRGYAPVLHCPSCAWKSECPHCSAFLVFHRTDRCLRCHHCGLQQAVPQSCPSCGDPDIRPVGRGTQRLEDEVARELAHLRGRNGEPPRLLRIDADAARSTEELQRRMQIVHAGEADILIGTQMVAKGHDFRRITLVAALEGDAALFSADFRAAERWFALLLQAAGRAGRADLGPDSPRAELWVHTRHPSHPMFAALDRMALSPVEAYERFAQTALREREQAGLPPFVFQALLRADARDQDTAQAWLRDALALAPANEQIQLYAPVPLPVARVADVERAQLLIESASRKALQGFLAQWQPALHDLHARRASVAHGRVLRWAIDVDPQSI